jgi:hypothetical protein
VFRDSQHRAVLEQQPVARIHAGALRYQPGLDFLPAFQRLPHAKFHVRMVHHAVALAGMLPFGALGDLLLQGAILDAEFQTEPSKGLL